MRTLLEKSFVSPVTKRAQDDSCPFVHDDRRLHACYIDFVGRTGP